MGEREGGRVLMMGTSKHINFMIWVGGGGGLLLNVQRVYAVINMNEWMDRSFQIVAVYYALINMLIFTYTNTHTYTT